MGRKHIETSDSKKRARNRTISQFFIQTKSQICVPQESIQTQKGYQPVEVANTEEHDKTQSSINQGGFSIEDAIDIDGDDCCDEIRCDNLVDSAILSSSPSTHLKHSTPANVTPSAHDVKKEEKIKPTISSASFCEMKEQKSGDSVGAAVAPCDNNQHKSDLKIKKDLESIQSPADKDAEIPQNPFASFAFSGSDGIISTARRMPQEKNTCAAVDVTLSLSTPPPSINPSMCSNTASPGGQLFTALNKNRSNQNNIRRRLKKTSLEVCSFEDLPYEERQRCLTKWQSFADANAPLEQRRFQVLVAARLHAQAQEPVIREAMKSLRAALAEDPKCHMIEDKIAPFPLSVDRLAQADPETLAQVISSVHFYNSKSRQIVKAAGEIKSRFGGIVPESKHGLVQITGIGPKLAEILSRVNTRAAYKEGEEGNVDDNVNGIRFRGSTLQSMQKDDDTKSVASQSLQDDFAVVTPSSKKKRRKDPD